MINSQSRHIIEVIDDTTSLVAARAERQAQALVAADLKGQARKMLADRLKPERCGIGAAELQAGAPDMRARVRRMAGEVVGELQRRGLSGSSDAP